jgi:hypothetical protein
MGSTDTAVLQRVSKFCVALRPFFLNGIPPEDVLDKIKAGGGFASLAKAHVKSPRQPKKASEQQGSAKLGRSAGSQRPAPDGGGKAITLSFMGRLSDSAKRLLSMPQGTHARLHVRIDDVRHGQFEVTIFEATALPEPCEQP